MPLKDIIRNKKRKKAKKKYSHSTDACIAIKFLSYIRPTGKITSVPYLVHSNALIICCGKIQKYVSK